MSLPCVAGNLLSGLGRRRGGLRAAVFLLVLGGFVAGPAIAEEPISESEYKKRRSALRSAGGRYITHRKKFPAECPHCRGTGSARVRRGRRIVRQACKQCVGKGVYISKKAYREVYYDMRTPAFRAIPGIKDVLGKQYDLARHGRPWPMHIQRYRLSGWEMVDATHGIVWFKYNASLAPTATRWIFTASDGGGKPRWYLWDERSDGAWPSGRVDPTGGAPAPAPAELDVMTADHAKHLRGALARARLTFRVDDRGMDGTTLRLALQPGPDPEGRPPVDRVAVDAVRLARAALDDTAPWKRLEAVWHDHFQDTYGRIVLRPRWLSALDKTRHDATDWASLSLDAQVGVLAVTELTYEGWKPVQGSQVRREPKRPDPPQTPEPTPTPEAPREPEPAPPAKPEPTPAPAPPPATAPSDGALPDLTTKAERAAKAGLVEIRALLAAATEAFNAGQAAHKDGAHDLWQEKLAEARTHLDGIKTVWYETIVPAMPGRDEIEQDAVANEHYGDVWDQVSKLESIVRKVSAAR